MVCVCVFNQPKEQGFLFPQHLTKLINCLIYSSQQLYQFYMESKPGEMRSPATRFVAAKGRADSSQNYFNNGEFDVCHDQWLIPYSIFYLAIKVPCSG